MDHHPNLTVVDLIKDRQIADEVSKRKHVWTLPPITGVGMIDERKDRFQTTLKFIPYLQW